MNRRIKSLLAVGVLAAAGTTAAVAGVSMAGADTQICDQYGTTTIQGKYVVMNNRWGTSAQQCINVTSTGFQITSQQGTGNTSGAPVSYPAIYVGCHYTNCSPGTNLPMQISQIGSANTSISYTYVSGATYDAAYDIWLDPTAKRDGVNQTEIMIWFNRQGSIQPIGSQVATGNIGGRSWNIWQGNNGSNNVISFVAPSAISSWSFNALDFINEAINRGLAQRSWYLTSMQAGFEPWIGGTGLAVNSFSADVTGGGNNSQSSSRSSSSSSSRSSSSSSRSSSSSSGGNTGGACSVNYATNSWGNGFTANVTIRNNSSSTINGWTLTFNFPGNQQVTSAWNATVTQSGGAVTARSMSYNGSIPANGSQSFGFQGSYSGTNGNASGFNLNGTACSAG